MCIIFHGSHSEAVPRTVSLYDSFHYGDTLCTVDLDMAEKV